MASLTRILAPADSVLQYLNHPNVTARDRSNRLIQSLARLLAWHIESYPRRHKLDPSVADSLVKLARQISLTSKLTRVQRIPDFLRGAARAATNASASAISSYLTVTKMLSLFVFSILDFASYLNVTGIRHFPKGAIIQRRAYQAWLLSIICGLFAALRDIAHYRREVSQVREAEAQSKNYLQRRSTLLSRLCVDLCDLISATSILGYQQLNQGVVSSVGCVGNIISIYTNPL
ncbi:peroxisomal biogenesis factor 11 [Xylogone sp. PMI_703]|nr:peroxisomal biogenesis factor 11 [Xylogone sp. PMI_703]